MMGMTKCKFKDFYSEFVHLPSHEVVLERLNKALLTRHFETCGVLLVGPSGVGKTRLAREFLKRYPPITSVESDQLQVLMIEASATYSELLNRLLEALGMNTSESTVAARQAQVIRLIQQHDIKYVFIDEMENLSRSAGSTPANIGKSRHYFKELTNRTSAVWVLIGVENLVQFVSVDEQLASRFTKTIQVPSLSMMTDRKHIEFVEYLFSISERLDVSIPYLVCLNNYLCPDTNKVVLPNKVDNGAIKRVLLATGGRARGIRELFFHCIQLAPTGPINETVMEEAYEEGFSRKFQIEKINPFTETLRHVEFLLKEAKLYE